MSPQRTRCTKFLEPVLRIIEADGHAEDLIAGAAPRTLDRGFKMAGQVNTALE